MIYLLIPSSGCILYVPSIPVYRSADLCCPAVTFCSVQHNGLRISYLCGTNIWLYHFRSNVTDSGSLRVLFVLSDCNVLDFHRHLFLNITSTSHQFPILFQQNFSCSAVDFLPISITIPPIVVGPLKTPLDEMRFSLYGLTKKWPIWEQIHHHLYQIYKIYVFVTHGIYRKCLTNILKIKKSWQHA